MGGSARRNDGSVRSANTPGMEKDSFQQVDTKLYKVILTKIFYTDDPKNISKGAKNPEIVYEGLVIGGKNEGQKVTNIRDASYLTGSENNFGERVYRVNSNPFTSAQGVKLSEQDGDLVYVLYIDGKPSFPIIVGAATNQLDGDNTGATKADGPRTRWEYNGVFFEIDKNGKLNVRIKGGTLDPEANNFTPGTEAVDPINFSVDAGSTEAPKELVTLTFKSGLVVTIDGLGDKVTMVTTGGAKIDILGSDDKLVIQAGLIEIGEGATESIVLGDTWKIFFDAHIHPTGVGPSGPPTIPQPPTTLSDQSKAKK